MSTWLESWDGRYTDRVRLLVEILPVLAKEPRFALKRELWMFPYSRRTTNLLRRFFTFLYGRGSRD